MDTMAIVGAVFLFVTVVFLMLGLSAGGQTAGAVAARQRLEGFKRGGQDIDLRPAGASFSARVAGPIFRGGGAVIGGLLPKGMMSGVAKKLIIAGEPMTTSGFLTMLFITSASAAGFGVLLIVVTGGILSIKMMGIVAAMLFVGFYLPFYIVGSRAKARQTAIIKSLADAFDLITTCVEAGLGLDAALARVAEKVPGPFAEELTRSLRDVALGKTRRDALKELGERTDVPDLIQFTNAVIQAEAMGSSIGTVLRVQAEQLRTKRRQRAEEAAYKAPVKMLFPLVLFIFPTLFIVILGPAGITIMQGFPK